MSQVPIKAHSVVLERACPRLLQAVHGGTAVVPGLEPEVFEQLLAFVYTGSLYVEDAFVGTLWDAGRRLDLPELCALAQRHVQESLAVSNAVFFANFARDAGLHDLLASCLRVISTHARKAVASGGFCHLAAASLGTLLSDDALDLPEAHVFRTMLAWAKFQTGHSTVDHVILPENAEKDEDDAAFGFDFAAPPDVAEALPEPERAALAAALRPVAHHLRVLLLDPQFVLDQIVPLRVLPADLMAVCNGDGGGGGDSPYSRPRRGTQTFQESTLLGVEQQRQVNEWYGKPGQKWRLLFRASRDGFAAAEFHKACGRRRPTVCVAAGPGKRVFGGLTDQPWALAKTGAPKVLPSRKGRTFMFSFGTSQGPRQYAMPEGQLQVVSDSEYGPYFGTEAEPVLRISNQCNLNSM